MVFIEKSMKLIDRFNWIHSLLFKQRTSFFANQDPEFFVHLIFGSVYGSRLQINEDLGGSRF